MQCSKGTQDSTTQELQQGAQAEVLNNEFQNDLMQLDQEAESVKNNNSQRSEIVESPLRTRLEDDEDSDDDRPLLVPDDTTRNNEIKQSSGSSDPNLGTEPSGSYSLSSVPVGGYSLSSVPCEIELGSPNLLDGEPNNKFHSSSSSHPLTNELNRREKGSPASDDSDAPLMKIPLSRKRLNTLALHNLSPRHIIRPKKRGRIRRYAVNDLSIYEDKPLPRDKRDMEDKPLPRDKRDMEDKPLPRNKRDTQGHEIVESNIQDNIRVRKKGKGKPKNMPKRMYRRKKGKGKGETQTVSSNDVIEDSNQKPMYTFKEGDERLPQAIKDIKLFKNHPLFLSMKGKLDAQDDSTRQKPIGQFNILDIKRITQKYIKCKKKIEREQWSNDIKRYKNHFIRWMSSTSLSSDELKSNIRIEERIKIRLESKGIQLSDNGMKNINKSLANWLIKLIKASSLESKRRVYRLLSKENNSNIGKASHQNIQNINTVIEDDKEKVDTDTIETALIKDDKEKIDDHNIDSTLITDKKEKIDDHNIDSTMIKDEIEKVDTLTVESTLLTDKKEKNIIDTLALQKLLSNITNIQKNMIHEIHDTKRNKKDNISLAQVFFERDEVHQSNVHTSVTKSHISLYDERIPEVNKESHSKIQIDHHSGPSNLDSFDSHSREVNKDSYSKIQIDHHSDPSHRGVGYFVGNEGKEQNEEGKGASPGDTVYPSGIERQDFNSFSVGASVSDETVRSSGVERQALQKNETVSSTVADRPLTQELDGRGTVLSAVNACLQSPEHDGCEIKPSTADEDTRPNKEIQKLDEKFLDGSVDSFHSNATKEQMVEQRLRKILITDLRNIMHQRLQSTISPYFNRNSTSVEDQISSLIVQTPLPVAQSLMEWIELREIKDRIPTDTWHDTLKPTNVSSYE